MGTDALNALGFYRFFDSVNYKRKGVGIPYF